MKDEGLKPPKRNKTYVILVVIILLGVAGVLGYYYGKDVFKGKKEESVDYTLKSELKMTNNDLSDFDLYFLKLENEKNKNLVYSPLSIKYALQMLSEGANGETKAQIDAILGNYTTKKYVNSPNMSLANALFIRDTFKDSINKDYITNLKSRYGAEVITDSFSSPDTINNWVKDKTLNLINDLVDDVSDLDFVLTNALAIDMEWVDMIKDYSSYNYQAALERFSVDVGGLLTSGYLSLPFEGLDYDTKAVDFAAYANKYDIVKDLGEANIKNTLTQEYQKWVKEYPEFPNVCEIDGWDSEEFNDGYLNQYIQNLNTNYGNYGSSTDFKFYVDDNVKVFAKDLKKYNGTTLQYVGIMPVKAKLEDYINRISAKDLNEIIGNLKDIELDSFEEGYATVLNGIVPLFQYEAKLELVDDLKTLGITDVFNKEKSDLSGITTGAYIKKGSHKANIEFSNEGIKAAAATSFGGAGDTNGGCFSYSFDVPIKEIDLTFNRPYIYIIRDKDTGEVWFTGSVYSPTKEMSLEDYHSYDE